MFHLFWTFVCVVFFMCGQKFSAKSLKAILMWAQKRKWNLAAHTSFSFAYFPAFRHLFLIYQAHVKDVGGGREGAVEGGSVCLRAGHHVVWLHSCLTYMPYPLFLWKLLIDSDGSVHTLWHVLYDIGYRTWWHKTWYCVVLYIHCSYETITWPESRRNEHRPRE